MKAEISTFWSQIVAQVQQTMINILMEGGLTLLMNFLTSGLHQAVSIIRKIYQIIKNLKAQATRMLSVVNAVFQSIGGIVDGKLDNAVAFVEGTGWVDDNSQPPIASAYVENELPKDTNP